MTGEKDKRFSFGITTLAGAKPWIIRKLGQEFKVDPDFRTRWLKTKWLAYGLHLLSWFDSLAWSFLKKPKDPVKPIFIIGHWRSGTTLMHRLLCDITVASYCTTYQNVFPNNVFAFREVLRGMVQRKLPEKRPADQVPMHTLFPQEEELTLGNTIYHCFYYWMFFPNKMDHFARKYLAREGLSGQDVNEWKLNYRRFVQRCMKHIGGRQFVSKNPPNTTRIKWLLDLYPDARFIFLHRNPYDAIASTMRFYKGILPANQNQKITDDELRSHILYTHKVLHQQYLKERELIPEGQLVELAFSSFHKAPVEVAAQSLKALDLDFDLNTAVHKKYAVKDHRTKQYEHSRELIQKVNDELAYFFDIFGYEKIDDEKEG